MHPYGSLPSGIHILICIVVVLSWIVGYFINEHLGGDVR
jgi:hypothetical protein